MNLHSCFYSKVFYLIVNLLKSVSFKKIHSSCITLEPARQCQFTSSICKDYCSAGEYGTTQWCGSCTTYLQCSDGLTAFLSCAPGNVCDDIMGACSQSSATCRECNFGRSLLNILQTVSL